MFSAEVIKVTPVMGTPWVTYHLACGHQLQARPGPGKHRTCPICLLRLPAYWQGKGGAA